MRIKEIAKKELFREWIGTQNYCIQAGAVAAVFYCFFLDAFLFLNRSDSV